MTKYSIMDIAGVALIVALEIVYFALNPGRYNPFMWLMVPLLILALAALITTIRPIPFLLGKHRHIMVAIVGLFYVVGIFSLGFFCGVVWTSGSPITLADYQMEIIVPALLCLVAPGFTLYRSRLVEPKTESNRLDLNNHETVPSKDLH